MEAARVLPRPAHLRRWLKVLAVLPLAPPLLFAAALFWPLPAPPLPEPGNSRLIVNARVVDVVRGQVSEPTTVTLHNGTITAIGESVADAALPVFDAGGRWLLPGFWDMQASHGSIEVGKAADLVLLDGNPLHDTANTRRVHAVLLAGHLYDRPRLDALQAYALAQARSPAVMARLLWGFATSPVSAEL
ncbi:TPA: hypothetical protein ACGRQA_003049 [Stenotrophomonas maltophilia]